MIYAKSQAKIRQDRTGKDKTRRCYLSTLAAASVCVWANRLEDNSDEASIILRLKKERREGAAEAEEDEEAEAEAEEDEEGGGEEAGEGDEAGKKEGEVAGEGDEEGKKEKKKEGRRLKTEEGEKININKGIYKSDVQIKEVHNSFSIFFATFSLNYFIEKLSALFTAW